MQLADAGRTLARLFLDAGRALAAHWPQLIGLFLIGWTGRMGLLWLTTEVSDWSPTAAVLILPLAPLVTLLSFVLMLRAMSPTLPAFAGRVEHLGPRQRWRTDLTVAGAVMIPFLAVYASAGLLREDARVFLIDSAADEFLNTTIQDIDFGRADYAPGWTVIVLIVVALAARKTITLLGLAKRHLAWAGVGAYLEALWIITLAQAMSSELANLTRWFTSRTAVAATIEWSDSLSVTLREWSSAVGALLDLVGSVVAGFGSLIIVPVAWLAVGAAVYGHQLNAIELSVPGHEEMTKRIARIPNPVQRAVSQVIEPVATPVQNTIGAIRKIAVAGILPMVLFCVAFLVASALQAATAYVMRILIGPGPSLRQFALDPYAQLAERGIYFVVALALLASAVNTVVTAQHRAAEQVPVTGSESPDSPVATTRSEPRPGRHRPASR